MTRKEAAQLMAILKAAYPYSYKGLSEQEAMGVISVWACQFADIPADIVHMALQKAISTSRFPPTISEVKAKVTSIYWEARELLNANEVCGTLPEETEKALQRICTVTREHRYTCGDEPSLARLMPVSDLKKIKGGEGE